MAAKLVYLTYNIFHSKHLIVCTHITRSRGFTERIEEHLGKVLVKWRWYLENPGNKSSHTDASSPELWAWSSRLTYHEMADINKGINHEYNKIIKRQKHKRKRNAAKVLLVHQNVKGENSQKAWRDSIKVMWGDILVLVCVASCVALLCENKMAITIYILIYI